MKKVLFVPDCHHPYVDRGAWECMLRAAHGFQPDELVVLGDFCDFYAVSSHSREPGRKTRLLDELEGVSLMADDLLMVGAKRNVYLDGNHEDRLRRYVWDRAPALDGLVDIDEHVLGPNRGHWERYGYGDGCWVGKVYCTHDLGKAGKYSVHHALADGGCNVVIGHTHRMGTVYGGNAHGETHVAASFGWLGRYDVAHDYKSQLLAMRDYQHGFGVGYVEDNGTVHLQAIPIVMGSCVVDGKLYRVSA